MSGPSLSIRAKIIAAISVIVATMAILVAYSLILLNDQSADGLVINVAGRQRMLSQKMSKEALSLLDTSIPASEAQASLKKTVALFDKSLNALINGDGSMGIPAASDPAVAAQLSKVKSIWRPFKQAAEALATSGDISDPEAAKDLKLMAQDNLKLLTEMNKAVGMMADNAGGKVRGLRVLLITGLALGVLIYLATLFMVNRSVARPLRRLVRDVEQLTAGDLKPFAHAKLGRDEIGRVGGALDELRLTLNEIIGMVAGRSSELAEGASNQAASVETTAASIEEITAMAKTSSDNSQSADSLMRDSALVLDQALGAMKRLRQEMEGVKAASDETVKIVRSIDEISFQTNLLALNAAVEAARAGEAGAGFAVVADEVRSLALRAAEAASSTQELIESNVQNIHTSTELVANTDEYLDQVQEKVSRMTGLVSEIAAASAEQVVGIDQVNGAITEVDEVAQGNAATAEEMVQSLSRFCMESDDAASCVPAGMAGSRHTPARAALPTSTPARPKPTRSAEEVIPFDDDDGDFEDF